MKFSEFADLPIIDCHVHFHHRGIKVTNSELKNVEEFMTEILRKGNISQIYITGGDAGLYLKVKYPHSFYAGGFVPWSGETDALPKVNWKSYISLLIEVGFDGIGEMGSKPVPRRKHAPLDGNYYKGFWEACESLGVTVLCHVADPEEFWVENLAPDWAKKRGWVYYAGDYPTKEELYSEMEHVLDAHPDLKVVLCHFYFMSTDLDRASSFLDHYRNAHFDLTPGIELIYNISLKRDDWRGFFIKYQDRLLFGTDIGMWETVEESVEKIWLVRNFLESDEEFFTPHKADMLLTRYEEPFIGLKLPVGVLRKIYADNFKRLWRETPRRVVLTSAVRMLEEKGETVIARALRRSL